MKVPNMSASRSRVRFKRTKTDKGRKSDIRVPQKPLIKEVKEEDVSLKKQEENVLNGKHIRQCILAGQDGMAKLYVALNKGEFCYDSTEDHYYRYENGYWVIDQINDSLATGIDKVIDCCISELERMRAEGVGHETHLWKLTNSTISKLHTNNYKKNVREMACQGKDGLAITGDEWDNHPLKLPCKDVYIDLPTGRVYPSRPHHYFRSHINTEVNADVGIPKELIRFFHSIFQYTVPPPRPEEFQYDNDPNQLTVEDRLAYETACREWEKIRKKYPFVMVDFMQRLLGYALRGDVKEHILIIFHGKGRNGKGVLIDLLLHVLGDFAGVVQPELLLSSSRAGSSANAAPDILDLRGRRVVFASETNEGRQLDSSNVKRLVGGDQLVGRGLFAKYMTRFQPSHTLFLITNNKPMASPDDFALWERMIFVPFMVSFVENPDSNNPSEGKIDKDLATKLKAEAPSILNWLIQGHIKYWKEGLDIPEVIKNSTRQYQQEVDVLGHFIESACQVGSDHKIMARGLYEAYNAWCEDNGHKAYSNTRFGEKMKLRFERVRTNSGFCYIGITSDYSSTNQRNNGGYY